MGMDTRRSALLALAGDRQVLQTLAPDSALIKYLPPAQAAVDAFCRGDDAAMQTALAQLPFRSPYRDLRWLLKGLACHPRDTAAGRRYLAKIPQDSPFHLPARIADAILAQTPPATSPPVRDFMAAFHQAEEIDHAELLRRLIDQSGRQADAGPVLKSVLVHDPSLIPLYEQMVAPLSSAEQLRIRALHEEHHGDRHRAYELWHQLLADYRHHRDPLRAAAVARHQADLATALYGERDPRVAEGLILAKDLDPDHRATWLRLAAYYRSRGDTGKLRRLLTEALARFPDDGEFLLLAARAALDRGAHQKAAALARRLLRQDPIHGQAREFFFQAKIAQTRRHIVARRGHLAKRALTQAESVANADRERAQILVLQGMTAQIEGWGALARTWFHQARRLLSPTHGDWLIAVEASLTRQPVPVLRELHKQLRSILAHASLDPDKSTMTAMLADAAALAHVDHDAALLLLRQGNRYFGKLAQLDWSLKEVRTLGQLLLELECYQWLRDLVRNHREWSQNPPLLVYFDMAAKCRGVAENLNWHDLARLSQALERAVEAQDAWLEAQIRQLLEAHQGAFSLRSRAETADTRALDQADLLAQRMETAVKNLTGWLNPKRWLS